MTGAHLVIGARYHGPPGQAHGGYLAGRLAGLSAFTGATAVTLLAPVPLERSLSYQEGERRARLLDGPRLLATAAGVGSDGVPGPPWVEPRVARRAADGFAGARRHPYPTCFVCGPRAAHGDALRLAPGPVPGEPGTVACCWTPAGAAAPELVWSVLDCPGGWVLDLGAEPAQLSRLAAVVRAVPSPGREHVVVGRLVARHGRTFTSHTGLFDARGRMLAAAAATWVLVDPDGGAGAGAPPGAAMGGSSIR
jgi:hypothetical protein